MSSFPDFQNAVEGTTTQALELGLVSRMVDTGNTDRLIETFAMGMGIIYGTMVVFIFGVLGYLLTRKL